MKLIVSNFITLTEKQEDKLTPRQARIYYAVLERGAQSVEDIFEESPMSHKSVANVEKAILSIEKKLKISLKEEN